MTRKILVTLDGSALAESILPDAKQLAGSGGELILAQEAQSRIYGDFDMARRPLEDQGTYEYLEKQANLLRAEGFGVATRTLNLIDVAFAIDEAARILGVDFIACATHGYGPFGRLIHGSVVWRAVAHAEVPVLLRHPEDVPAAGSPNDPKTVLVPLDGSDYAERALPVAEELAIEWDVSVLLVTIVPDLLKGDAGFGPVTDFAFEFEGGMDEAKKYLSKVASGLKANVDILVRSGKVADGLAEVVEASSVSHVVMSSHGRTALSRVILGSVADSLVHRLHCPIIVIPALASQSRQADHHVMSVEKLAHV